MDYKEFHYRWEYLLRSDPEALWPFVADTNRFNRDAGVPAVKVKAVNRLPNNRREVGFRKLGLSLEWEEQPFEWLRPFKFGVVRRFKSGPVGSLRVLAELEPLDSGGTKLNYEVWATPRNYLGHALIPVQIGWLSARSFSSTIHQYDRIASVGKVPPYTVSDVRLSAREAARLSSTLEELGRKGAGPECVSRLGEMLSTGDDLSLARIRPYELADYWSVPRREALVTCLLATRVGLLDLHWDIICPHCRGPSNSGESLSSVSSLGSCQSCKIDFSVDFERSVELTFQPNPSIRQVKSQRFCVGGPEATPHIVAQQFLAPGERRKLATPLEPGRYRLRTLELPGALWLRVGKESEAREISAVATPDGWGNEELESSDNLLLVLENRTATEQLFILERASWGDQAATAAEVTALQIFRDLFSTEALRPGEQISVGSLTVLFTDLRGSTQMYREIGDANAFGRVMSHFDVLREAITAEDGALVKTIGDAVMAVFRNPAAALRAILTAQVKVRESQSLCGSLRIKAGLHSGPCIAVTLNERLDYFGSTVNLAARLEALSMGQDVVISPAVRWDPEIAAMISEQEENLIASPFEVPLKGFDDQRFELWRVSLGEGGSITEAARPN
jgi:class 3 adenylate cyclase